MQAHDTAIDDVFHAPPPLASEAAVRPSPARAALPAGGGPLACWTSALLSRDAPSGLRASAGRFATGLGLAALYGVALGTRQGKAALLTHALGVPAALLAVAVLGVPAFYIALALFDAPVDPPRFLAATARAAARAGLVMAGLAPAAALFVVSSDAPSSAAAAGAAGLAVGGAIGLAGLLRELNASLAHADHARRTVAALASGAFGVFAIALALRVWGSALPLLGGGR